MLCTNGHNNSLETKFCTICGINTFQGTNSLEVSSKNNGLAIASMVLGIVWVYWIGSILALIFGYTAKKQIKQRGGQGGGMATAGIVLGWVGIGFMIIIIFLVVLKTSLNN
jgi:hypothetical protein